LLLDGQIGNPTGAAELQSLKDVVTATIELVKPYGISEVYFYGMDEAREIHCCPKDRPGRRSMMPEARSWSAAIPAPLKRWGPFDLLIGPVPGQGRGRERHSIGHKIFSYANPQVGAENPELYRRNYGLRLWQNNYDGAMDFAYYTSSGNTWNDFDDSFARDMNFVYRP